MTILRSQKIFAALFLFIAVVLSNSCSTKKNTFTRRVYHNITAHYNAYWNGNEAIKAGSIELEKNAVDNYNKVLPVFNNGTKAEAQSIGPYMDRAIEKATKVIDRHSIYIRRKEHVRWIDDSYLMMAKAFFYKKEYRMAKRTCDFIISRYKREPIIYDAMLWKARTHIELDEFSQAESLLDLVQNKADRKQISEKQERYLALIYAEFFIKQENYPPALEHLLKAERMTSKKPLKYRLNFIIAQIFQKRGNLDLASDYYRRVIKRNSPFIMSFNSKINLAKCYNAATGDSKQLVKRLEKMLREEKNEEFFDQIYYALADIYFKKNDLPKAIDNLKKSVSTSISNNYQKAVSSLRLADIYFEEPNYKLAEAYYDTAIQVLPSDYPDYEIISNKAEVLSKLVENINVVELQDSLQKLAGMTEKERNKIIDGIIAEIKKQEQLEKSMEMEMQRGLGFLEQTNRQMNRNMQRGGGWYFYNPQAMSFGYTEFIKKWGKRKLEDNWRLSNKQMLSMDFGEEGMAEGDSLMADSLRLANDPKNRNTYLKNIPLTEEMMAVSNSKIIEALFNMGLIYKEGLNDYKKSVESFEELLERFPNDSIYELKVFYQLYKLYAELANSSKSEYYKNQILTKYPDSDYAKIILDPDYYKQIQASRNLAVKLYKETYLAYQDQQYSVVIQNSDKAINNYTDQELLAKFMYLRALALGITNSVDTLKSSLQGLITTYPNAEVQPLAKLILERLTGVDTITAQGDATIAGGSLETTSAISLYNYDANAIHLYALVVNIKDVNINALKIKISDFNQKYYSLDDLSITSVFLDDTHQIITVSNFADKENAIDYYDAINRSEYIFTTIRNTDYKDFVISVDNYPVFYKNRGIEQYMSFYQENYMGN